MTIHSKIEFENDICAHLAVREWLCECLTLLLFSDKGFAF
jgi:hypothetical protein